MGVEQLTITAWTRSRSTWRTGNPVCIQGIAEVTLANLTTSLRQTDLFTVTITNLART